MADLCTIEDLEIYLGIDINDDPSDLNDTYDKYSYLITAVSAEIESICGRKFTLDSYTETYDIDGSRINLNQYPINSITSVKYGSPFGGTDRTTIETDNYTTDNDSGILILNLRFSRAQQYINVTYDAGFDQIPDDLVLITVEEVVRAFNESTKDTNLKSEKLGDYSYSLIGKEEISNNFREKLKAYIRNDI